MTHPHLHRKERTVERYLDTALCPEERARDLLARMDLDEKFAQLQCWSMMDGFMGKPVEKSFPRGVGQVSCLAVTMMQNRQEVAALARKTQEAVLAASPHHIPAILHIETLTGALVTDASCFPCGLAQAATWDPATQRRMAALIGRQGRMLGFAEGLAPVLDICRDPRFGRQGEGYGEDPTLAAAMGAAYVIGLQQGGQMLATAKHFLGFMAGQGGIHAARTPIPPRELREVYAKPFQAAITRANLGGVMNSYASIDGEAVCGSPAILWDLLRGEMGFGGITVSDYSSVGQLATVHHLCKTKEEAGRLALEAGMDQELPAAEGYTAALRNAIAAGAVDPALLDEAVLRILTAKFRLGLFENPFPADEAALAGERYGMGLGQAISRQSAAESLVLLKNDGVLPLGPAHKKIAVIGWHGGSARALFGGYTAMAMKESSLGVTLSMAGIQVDPDAPAAAGGDQATYPGSAVRREDPRVEALVHRCYPGVQTLWQALAAACPDAEVRYAAGYPYAGNDESGFAGALDLARWADVVVCTLGGHYGWNLACTTGEGLDSQNIGLPACQEAFLRALAPLGKPVVGVHFDGRPCSSDAADAVCGALVEAWAPGPEGGRALAAALTGAENFTGKLPCTVAGNAAQIPLYYNHDNGSCWTMENEGMAPGYVDGPRTPRYAFGHGLSYTSFAYGAPELSALAVGPDGAVTVTVSVTNTGAVPGAEVVQLYVRDPVASRVRPNRELAGFARVPLDPGQTKRVQFRLEASQLAFLDRQGHWKVEAGEIQVLVGAASDDIRGEAAFTITADGYTEGPQRAFWAEARVE